MGGTMWKCVFILVVADINDGLKHTLFFNTSLWFFNHLIVKYLQIDNCLSKALIFKFVRNKLLPRN